MIHIELRGVRELLDKLDSSLLAGPLRNFYTRSAIAVQGHARTKTPVDAGALRARLDYEVATDGARVGFLSAHDGSELFYQARAMEYGTGRAGDPGVAHKGTHFPPPAALDLWAARHGLPNGFVVARAIAQHGGLRARRMLRDGLKESVSAIQGYADRMGQEIKALWEK